MARETKRILVRSSGRRVSGQVPVLLAVSGENAGESTVQREQMTLTPGMDYRAATQTMLDSWADYFAPSIEKALPASEQRFMPQRVAIEREVFYCNDDELERDDPQARRVLVTRRRVILFGTVQ